VGTFQLARANGQEYLPGTVGAGKGEAAVQILHFLPAPQAPPGLGRARRHFVEKRFDGAAKRPVDFELVRDRHLGNSAVSVTNMVRCFLLRLAGRRGAHCAKVRQLAIWCGAINESRGGNFRWAGGAADRYAVPCGFAQGRLSTSFGWRLTALMAELRKVLNDKEKGTQCAN
jgi:hypothetical protein